MRPAEPAPTPTPLAVPVADGWTLRTTLWEAARPRAGVVLGHAMLARRDAFDRPGGLAEFLWRRGYTVLNADLRGHGQSLPLPADGARWRLEDIAFGDVPALLSALRSRVEPVFAVGHSLFANALLLAAARQRLELAGFAGFANQLWLPCCTRGRLRRLQRGLMLEAMAALAWPQGSARGTLFGMGPEQVPYPFLAQMRDWYRADAWTAPDGFDYRAALATVRLPFLGLHSAADDHCRPEEARAFLAPLPAWEQRVLPAAALVSHMGVTTSRRALPLWEQLADWLDDLCSG